MFRDVVLFCLNNVWRHARFLSYPCYSYKRYYKSLPPVIFYRLHPEQGVLAQVRGGRDLEPRDEHVQRAEVRARGRAVGQVPGERGGEGHEHDGRGGEAQVPAPGAGVLPGGEERGQPKVLAVEVPRGAHDSGEFLGIVQYSSM